MRATGAATELALTARDVGGAEAQQLGLVARCLPDQQALMAAARQLAATLASKPSLALVGTKRVMLHARCAAADGGGAWLLRSVCCSCAADWPRGMRQLLATTPRSIMCTQVHEADCKCNCTDAYMGRVLVASRCEVCDVHSGASMPAWDMHDLSNLPAAHTAGTIAWQRG